MQTRRLKVGSMVMTAGCVLGTLWLAVPCVQADVATAETVRCLKQNSAATAALTEVLEWCVDGKYTQARELARDQYEENARLPTAERLPALVAWHLVSALDAEKTSSLAARYDQDSSRKVLTPALKSLQAPATAEDTLLVLLAFIRLDQNAETAGKLLKQLRTQLPATAGFGDGIRQLATAAVDRCQNADAAAATRWLSVSGPGGPRKGYVAQQATPVTAPTAAVVAVVPVPAPAAPVMPVIPAAKVEGTGVGLALIIGIGNYDIQGPLENCREDAMAFSQLLAARGYAPERVVLLTDNAATPENKATYANITSRIEQMCELVSPKDSLVVYFAGHGVTIKGEGYLVPQDADGQSTRTSLPMTWLQQQMQGSKAARKLLVLDACHSGRVTRGVSGIAPSIKTTGVSVMTSCAENELSYPDGKHGVFTKYMLEGLIGKADVNADGSVTQKELFAYVQAKLMEWGLKTGKKQRPQMLSPTADDMVVGKVPRS